MALLNTYTASNRVVQTGLCIRYQVELVDYTWYRVTRTAVKSYAYIGMTREAANACAAVKTALYCRNHYILDTSGTGTAQEPKPQVRRVECQASIAVQHSTFNAWTCAIQVNETDIRSAASAPADPAALFAEQNVYDYEELDRYAVQIVSAVFSAGATAEANAHEITFAQNFDEFHKDRLVVEYRDGPLSPWVAGAIERSSQTSSFVRITGSALAAGQFVRLRYGAQTSNIAGSDAPEE